LTLKLKLKKIKTSTKILPINDLFNQENTSRGVTALNWQHFFQQVCSEEAEILLTIETLNAMNILSKPIWTLKPENKTMFIVTFQARYSKILTKVYYSKLT
jgi:hypothetical protein